MEILQYSDQVKTDKNKLQSSNEFDELRIILLELGSRRNELFKSMNNETRQLCDRLIEYSLSLKHDKRLLQLVNEVFDDSQIYIPGSIGSFVTNCVFNQKKNQSINEEEKYSHYNFLFYHKIGNSGVFTPLRVDKSNKKFIILLKREDKLSFNLTKNKEKLKIFGVNSLDDVSVMNYNNSNDEVKNEKMIPKKGKSIAFSILLIVILLVIIFIIYLMSKN
jgi:hypothetical protein